MSFCFVCQRHCQFTGAAQKNESICRRWFTGAAQKKSRAILEEEIQTLTHMTEKTQKHVAEKEYDEDGAKSHVMIVEDRDDLRSLDTYTRSTPESRRQANLRAYLSLWNMIIRMELDASTLGERRDEEEDSDDQ